MKIRPPHSYIVIALSFLFGVLPAIPSVAQDDISGKKSKIDEVVKLAFASVKAQKWAEARASFEDALIINEKETVSSKYIISGLGLPDEDPNYVPRSREEFAVINYRHVMGTKQALLAYASFAAQLAGDIVAANKYHRQVYELRGPLWGTSWQAIMSPAVNLFHVSVPKQTDENFGHYLFLAGQLMWDSVDEKGRNLMEEAQKILPKDAKIAARLGSVHMILRDPVKAKPQSELSLSIDPKQPHVLIDLGTANFLLGFFDESIKQANAASQIASELPARIYYGRS